MFCTGTGTDGIAKDTDTGSKCTRTNILKSRSMLGTGTDNIAS
jgi:hypothetical protein